MPEVFTAAFPRVVHARERLSSVRGTPAPCRADGTVTEHYMRSRRARGAWPWVVVSKRHHSLCYCTVLNNRDDDEGGSESREGHRYTS